MTEHMYSLPTPPWAGKQNKTKKINLPGNSTSGKKCTTPVSYIQAATNSEPCNGGPDECQLHDSLLDQDPDLALTNKGFYSSKLCLINTESEESDAESEDVDTTEYKNEKATRRQDGYSASLQESMI